MKLALAAAALAASLAVAAPCASVAAGAGAARQAKDREEISALRWAYSRAIDTFNEDAYVAVFTPDGAFGATKGREALRKMVVDLKKGRADREAKGEPQPGLFHVESNEHLEFLSPDHARAHYYWMTVASGTNVPGSPPDPAKGPRVLAVGHGYDDIVRAGGKWLIQSRQVAPKDD